MTQSEIEKIRDLEHEILDILETLCVTTNKTGNLKKILINYIKSGRLLDDVQIYIQEYTPHSIVNIKRDFKTGQKIMEIKPLESLDKL